METRVKITPMNVSAVTLGIILILLVTYQKFIPIVILIWAAVSIGAIIQCKSKPRFNAGFVLMISLYVMYLVGIFWTENMEFAYSDLQVKLGLLLVPALFFFLKYDKQQLRMMFYGFFLGLLFSFIFSVVTSAVNYASSGLLSEFMFYLLSKSVHPTYLAFYTNIAITVLLVDFTTKRLALFSKDRSYLLLIVLFSIFSFILLSRLGIVTTLLLNSVLIVYWLISRRWLHASIVLIFVAIVPLIMIKSSIWARERLWDELKTEQVEAGRQIISLTTLRMEIWHDALTVYKKSPLLGFGTGDVQDEMIRQYNEDGFNQALEENLNPHNQFLQTGIALGVLGMLLVLAILTFSLSRLKRQFYFSGLFGIISFMFFMTESVLETQAGVVGFAFFYCLFFMVDGTVSFKKRPQE